MTTSRTNQVRSTVPTAGTGPKNKFKDEEAARRIGKSVGERLHIKFRVSALLKKVGNLFADPRTRIGQRKDAAGSIKRTIGRQHVRGTGDGVFSDPQFGSSAQASVKKGDLAPMPAVARSVAGEEAAKGQVGDAEKDRADSPSHPKKPFHTSRLIIESNRQAAIAMKPAEKVELFTGFVTTEVMGKPMSKADVAKFMRYYVEGTTERGLLDVRARAALRSIGEECFGKGWSQALAVLRSMPNFDYDRDQNETEPQPRESDVRAARDAMDRVMPFFLGGKDGAAIDSAVNRLPQHFCDLVARARQALDHAQFADDVHTGDGKKKLQANLDANLLGLGVLVPLFNAAQTADARPEAFGVALGQFKTLLLAIANGANPFHDNAPLSKAQQEFQASAFAWGKAYRLFLDKAAARGTAGTTSELR
jgi:hypothetical protein